MLIQLKIRFKKKGLEVLKYLIFRAKSNVTLKKILHPILIKAPFLNKVLSYFKKKISTTPSVIGPLVTSPSKTQDLTAMGLRLYDLLQQELSKKASHAHID